LSINFSHSYADLPEVFHTTLPPVPVAAPALFHLNHALARDLGLDPAYLATDEGVAMLAGNFVPHGAHPIAMAYSGHQFGHWSGQLGDGRAILLGEIETPANTKFDVQLKGSGRTPYSRGGDGRAVLGAVLREVIVSEAMAALGIPTTRALAAVTTGEPVQRETALAGAVLTRIAASHIRVGTFQHFFAAQDTASLRRLSDYVIARHYPEAAQDACPALGLLRAVLKRQADLIARWMQVGFIHGVMNTDNMSLAGETIDYGPCAFMDAYHPGKVFSSIDHQGRYAYNNQPAMAMWNLAQFAGTLVPVIESTYADAQSRAQGVLDGFGALFNSAYQACFAAKIGLGADNREAPALLERLLSLMAESGADFTLTFQYITRLADTGDGGDVPAGMAGSQSFDAWLADWRQAFDGDPVPTNTRMADMHRANPVYIARNHRVEAALEAAYQGDHTPFETLLDVLSKPLKRRELYAAFENAPEANEIVHATFCGT